MSESVSGVDAILAGLRELPQYVITIQDREGYTYERGSAAQPMNYTGIMLEDAERFVEAAVHATAQKYESALARQGAMLDR